jgi:hypothetical protein
MHGRESSNLAVSAVNSIRVNRANPNIRGDIILMCKHFKRSRRGINRDFKMFEEDFKTLHMVGMGMGNKNAFDSVFVNLIAGNGI